MTRAVLLSAIVIACGADAQPPSPISSGAAAPGAELLDHDCRIARRVWAGSAIEVEAVRMQCLQNKAILELAGAVRALADRPVAIPERVR